MTLNSVVLPEPLGPINPVIEPCSTAIEQVERAWIPPKALETACTSNKLMRLSLPSSFCQHSGLLLACSACAVSKPCLASCPPGPPPFLQRWHNASWKQQENRQEERTIDHEVHSLAPKL